MFSTSFHWAFDCFYTSLRFAIGRLEFLFAFEWWIKKCTSLLMFNMGRWFVWSVRAASMDWLHETHVLRRMDDDVSGTIENELFLKLRIHKLLNRGKRGNDWWSWSWRRWWDQWGIPSHGQEYQSVPTLEWSPWKCRESSISRTLPSSSTSEIILWGCSSLGSQMHWKFSTVINQEMIGQHSRAC